MVKSFLRKLRWFHIVLASIIILLLISVSPVYPGRIFSSEDNTTLVVLTFDDGYSSWVTEAMPILQEYDLPASGYINDPEFREDFTWEYALTLHEAGWEIGWHTATHMNVDVAERSQLIDDYNLGKSLFEAHGLPAPVTFVYPSGRHDDESVEITSEFFLAARTTHHGVNTPRDVMENPAHLKQFNMDNDLPFIEKKIRKYQDQGMLIVLTAHTIGQVVEWQKNPTMTTEEFEDLAEFLHQEEVKGNIDVVTLREGVEIIQNRNVITSWGLKVDSPSDTWFKFWKIPVPERYFVYYEEIIQDFIGHSNPGIARWFDQF